MVPPVAPSAQDSKLDKSNMALSTKSVAEITNTKVQTAPFPFMKLPLELRNMVYTEHIANTTIHFDVWETADRRQQKASKQLLALSRVSSQVHVEFEDNLRLMYTSHRAPPIHFNLVPAKSAEPRLIKDSLLRYASSVTIEVATSYQIYLDLDNHDRDVSYAHINVERQCVIELLKMLPEIQRLSFKVHVPADVDESLVTCVIKRTVDSTLAQHENAHSTLGSEVEPGCLRKLEEIVVYQNVVPHISIGLRSNGPDGYGLLRWNDEEY